MPQNQKTEPVTTFRFYAGSVAMPFTEAAVLRYAQIVGDKPLEAWAQTALDDFNKRHGNAPTAKD